MIELLQPCYLLPLAAAAAIILPGVVRTLANRRTDKL